jgi:scyllo-inositol 2-dehydrogenase (NADP+)
MRRLRAGLVGAGWVAAHRHAPALARHSEVDVVAVLDSHPERAHALVRRAQLEGARVYADLDSFLRAGLDLVSVATSPWSHCEVTVAALTHGAHVFTEKPMAMSLPEAQAMVDTASATGRLLCVSHNFRFSRSGLRADELLAGDTIERVLGLQLSSPRRRLPTWYRGLPGGLLFDEIPHLVYMLDHLLGGNLTVAHARGRVGADGHPTTADVLLDGARGPGQITMTFDSPVSEWHLVVVAQQKVLVLDLFRDILLHLRPDGRHRAVDIARSSGALVGGHVTGFAATGTRLARGRQSWGHEELIGRFVDAVQGRGPVPVTASEALSVVRTVADVVDALNLVEPSRP